MNEPAGNKTEVLIAGAGPAGLMMACQLALHKVTFRIIDKNESPSVSSGALILQARSLEIFEQMHIAGKALNEGIIARNLNLLIQGKKITSIAIHNMGDGLSQFPFMLMLEQSKTEKLLLNFIADHGFIVERGKLLNRFHQENGEVSSEVVLANGDKQMIQSKYIIAADGYHSDVRNYLHIPFPGKTYSKPLFILDCKPKIDLVNDEISFALSGSSVAGFFPLVGSRWRIDGTFPRKVKYQKNDIVHLIKNNIRDWTKMDIQLQDPEWFSVFHSHQQYAEKIRVQNCFLIGDAAHVNSPVGAQGMNTGLQDAYNLAWKLAFVLKHKANPEILNTYSTERLGITKGFAHYADIVFRLLASHNGLIIFFRMHVLGLFLKWLFQLVGKRKTFQQLFFKSISQTNFHYHNSLLTFANSESSFKSGAPKPGDQLPFLEIFHDEKKFKNYNELDATRFTLLVFANDLKKGFVDIAKKFPISVGLFPQKHETLKAYEVMGISISGYYLVRPDMHIALRSDTLDPFHLNNYLNQLFN